MRLLIGGAMANLIVALRIADLASPIVGATDIAMRHHLPPTIMACTVTRPLFAQLCAHDERSYLHKPFWRRLRAARGGAEPAENPRAAIARGCQRGPKPRRWWRWS